MEKESKKHQKNVEYKLQFAREKYKRIPLDVPIKSYEKWKKAAETAGLPLNTFIKSAVEEKISTLFAEN